ncbi:hypothetical protein [Mycobacterium paragordonae]|nr:hypothetical protein [Mycobacterium paragordonae]
MAPNPFPLGAQGATGGECADDDGSRYAMIRALGLLHHLVVVLG